MDTLMQLEKQVTQLSASELKAFRDWFESFDEMIWDKKIEEHQKEGALATLAAKALSDFKMGNVKQR